MPRIEQELNQFPQIEHQRPTRRNAVFDLDGVMLRWVNAHLPNSQDETTMLLELQKAGTEGLDSYVLTNRPPGQMAALAYTLGIDYGYWVTESGGSFYDVRNHRSYVMPEWAEMARTRIPELRSHLHRTLGVAFAPEDPSQPQFEPGMGFVKTVLVPPRGISLETFGTAVREALIGGGFDRDFSIEVGKAVDIDPKGLSKAKGMEALLSLNRIDPQQTPTLFIADHKRDIPAATILHDRGGLVAAVGNSAPEYRDAVAQFGGIVASPDTLYHSSVTQILRRFVQE